MLLDNTDPVLTKTILFGNGFHNLNNNFKIITKTIEFILSTKRYDEPGL